MSRKSIAFFIITGVLCLVAALGLAARNIMEERHAEVKVKESVTYLEKVIPVKPSEEQPIVPEPQVVMTEVEYEGNGYIGVLEIPALELELSVQGEWSYPRLKESPCLYMGNIYDGMIIAGHNYGTHFGGLKNLAAGDVVTFTDVDGNVWSYTVSTVETIAGYDIEAMSAGDWDLTLFTCTYGGQNRVTVRCAMNK